MIAPTTALAMVTPLPPTSCSNPATDRRDAGHAGVAPAPAGDGRHDFDFLRGHWRVENHRLAQRFVGSDDWERFEAVQTNSPLPGGIGNYDDFIAPHWRPGFVGMSLRLFNPLTRRWSIYWLDNRSGGLDAAGTLTPPVVGRFSNGIGIFEGDDIIEGRQATVRYRWSDITASSARWEQAMSIDGGRTWEVNWIMVMTRASRAHPLQDARANTP